MQEKIVNIPPTDRMTDESFKRLCTNLQLSGTDVKTIMITSSIPSEGKTTVSMYVAKGLAEMGKKVLLIDADMRNLVLMSRLAVGTKVRGLSNFLNGQVELQDILWKTSVSKFHLVFGGDVPPNPVKLLNSQKFSSLIKGARAAYDYVIIDTPPLGSVVDAIAVANECDGSVFVIGADKASRRLAKKVLSQLSMSNCPVLGTVLNNVDMKKSTYGQYYGKYYGKYYGQKVEN